MTQKLIHLVPDMPEITAMGAPSSIRVLKTLVDHVGELTMAVRRIAESQDQGNGTLLVVAARVEGLSKKLDDTRENSSHDIQIVRGSIKDAVVRAMTEDEQARFARQQSAEKRKWDRLVAIATIAAAGWPILGALYYLLTHMPR